MCLGIPGRVLEIDGGEGLPTGRVDFSGAVKEVCLAYVPDVTVGEYVIVHVGFAISKVDEAEAQRTLEILREMGDLAARELDPEATGTRQPPSGQPLPSRPRTAQQGITTQRPAQAAS